MHTLWGFKTQNFCTTLAWDYETDGDTSWDETGETDEKLASGEWVNCVFRVRVTGPNGEALGEDYLGNSIHADPADFRDHIGAAGAYGSYFTDMVHSAISQAREAIAATRNIRLRETA